LANFFFSRTLNYLHPQQSVTTKVGKTTQGTSLLHSVTTELQSVMTSKQNTSPSTCSEA